MTLRPWLGLVRDWLRERREQRFLAPLRERWRALATLPPPELTAEVVARLRRILEHASRTVPFWRERLRAAGIHPDRVDSLSALRDLPLLARDEVMARGAEMLSEAIPERERLPARTGGSSTVPLSFFRDPLCLRERRALQDVFFEWAGRGPGDRWGLVWGAAFDLHQRSSLADELHELLVSRRVTLVGSYLRDAEMRRFLERCDRLGVRILHGYSNALWQLARFAREHGLRPRGLRGITATAEPLSDTQRAEIRDAFGVPVYLHYGAREIGIVAAECGHHPGMHYASPSVLIEFLQPDGTPCPPGQPGEVIVTDLLNRAMPFIRYRIGDIGTPLPPATDCRSSFPLLRIDAGKIVHYLALPDGRTIPGAPIVINLDAPGLQGVYLEQTTPDAVTVLWIPADDFEDSALDHVRDQLERVVGNQLEIRFRRIDSPPLTPSGKIRVCYSTVWEQRLRS